MVGIDLTWDQMILSALPPRIKAVWLVNEDEHVKEAFRSMYERIEQFKFITGSQGGYEKFLKAFYWQINSGIPPCRDELTSRLLHQINVMQRDLTNIKDGIKGLHEELRSIQHQITKLSYRLEQGTAVMILDSVDATNDESLKCIAITLRDVINDKKLFVVLVRKRGLLFDFERSISRKLTSRQLKPLDRKSIEHFAPDLKRGSNLAYMKLPRSINNDTDILRKASCINDGISADVLLVTVTDVEAKAIFDLFPNRSQRVIGGRIYYDLGLVGTAKTFMAQSTGAGPAHARICIEEGIQALSPPVVIMVGIAFGLLPATQHIGDILVSQQIEDYDQQKISTGPNGQRKIYARGDRVRASERLLNRFRAGRHEWQTPPDVHFGLILSGSRLVSHKGFRDELLRVAPEAIGGEMEGTSLYEVANRKHVEWVLVKAICDWADAGKNDAHQMLAAKNAARFVIQVVGQDQFV